MSALCDSNFSLTAAAIIIYPICFVAGLIIGIVCSFFVWKWKKNTSSTNSADVEKRGPVEVKSSSKSEVHLPVSNNPDPAIQRRPSSRTVEQQPTHHRSERDIPIQRRPSAIVANFGATYQNTDDVVGHSEVVTPKTRKSKSLKVSDSDMIYNNIGPIIEQVKNGSPSSNNGGGGGSNQLNTSHKTAKSPRNSRKGMKEPLKESEPQYNNVADLQRKMQEKELMQQQQQQFAQQERELVVEKTATRKVSRRASRQDSDDVIAYNNASDYMVQTNTTTTTTTTKVTQTQSNPLIPTSAIQPQPPRSSVSSEAVQAQAQAQGAAWKTTARKKNYGSIPSDEIQVQQQLEEEDDKLRRLQEKLQAGQLPMTSHQTGTLRGSPTSATSSSPSNTSSPITATTTAVSKIWKMEADDPNKYPFYWGPLSRPNAETLLNFNTRQGCYLMREGNGGLVLSVWNTTTQHMTHFVIKQLSSGYQLERCEDTRLFRTFGQLVETSTVCQGSVPILKPNQTDSSSVVSSDNNVTYNNVATIPTTTTTNQQPPPASIYQYNSPLKADTSNGMPPPPSSYLVPNSPDETRRRKQERNEINKRKAAKRQSRLEQNQQQNLGSGQFQLEDDEDEE